MKSADIVFVADVFLEDLPLGGGELVNKEIVKLLRESGYRVEEVYAIKTNATYIKARKDCLFIVSSFLSMPPDGLHEIQKTNYILYEHDHKYLISRNPALHPNFVIPKNQLVYQDLYKKAARVVCQSQLHLDIAQKNMPHLGNLYNIGGSLWDESFLESLEVYLETPSSSPKKDKVAIIRSDNPIKGQEGAERYCKENHLDYEIIEGSTPLELFKKLTTYKSCIFLPTTPETFSRIFIEAKLAGCKIITNQLIGAAYEDYAFNDPPQLLRQLRTVKSKVKDLIVKELEKIPKNPEKEFIPRPPQISIITSIYKGEKFIDQFLRETVQQSIFADCELILIDCNEQQSSEHEAISAYQKKYKNIHYYHLERDPGVYGAWNYAISKSTGKYITNANLDDQRSYDNLRSYLEVIKANPDIDLVYPAFLITHNANETFYTTKSRSVYESHDFSPQMMVKCLPGCMPMWRSSLHTENGLFDASLSSAGDLEFWLRCVKNGSAFKRVPEILGLYYYNPDGLSTSPQNNERKTREEKKVFEQYQEVLQQ